MNRVAHPLREPWVITAEGKAKVLGIYERAHELGLAARVAERQARIAAGEAFEHERRAELVGQVAVIYVDGPLMRKAGLFSDISGATSYEWIGRMCAETTELYQQGRARTALFVFNTPGGEAAGCGIAADAIRALTELMHVEGYAETQAASGGQWLISQCTRVSAHRQAFLGSLGVRSMVIDDSGFGEKVGIKEIEIVADGSPAKRNTPVDDAVLAREQKLVNDIFSVFVDAVATGRGVTVDEAQAKFGQGAQLIATDALEVGLIDEVADLDTVLARLQAVGTLNGPGVRAGTKTMQIKTKTPGASAPAVEGSDSEWQCKGCSQMMGASAERYCAHCMEGDEDEDEEGEDAKALAAAGLRGKTVSETRKKLVAFVASVLEASGTKTASAAIPAILSGAQAKEDLRVFKEKSEADAGTARAKAVSDKLAGAIAAGKLTLGVVSKECPLLSGAPKAKVRAALAAITTQDAASVVGAVVSAGVSEEFAASVDEWLESKGASALPTPHRQPGAADGEANAAVKPPAITLPGDLTGTPLSIDSVLKAAEKK